MKRSNYYQPFLRLDHKHDLHLSDQLRMNICDTPAEFHHTEEGAFAFHVTNLFSGFLVQVCT